jgi:hypothetical protein
VCAEGSGPGGREREALYGGLEGHFGDLKARLEIVEVYG